MKNTRKALLLSVMSLLICVSMLVGTTFAWFTDAVSTGNNVIAAGNLDIDLEYSTDMSNWNSVGADTNIFKTGALWEPGYTEVVYLRVSNIGTLAMKYQLGINIVSETAGKDKDGNSFKLSDYIQYGVVENATKYADRTAARNAVTSPEKLNKVFSKEYSLVGKTAAATDSDVFALVAYMPESVGNEANHNGVNKPEIKLGLTVLAAQNTVESDSFNNQYDKDALYAVGDGLYTDETGNYVALDNQGLYTASKLASTDPAITSVTFVTDEGEVEVPVVTSPSDLKAAVTSKEEIVVLTSGDYTLPSNMTAGQEISVVGNKDTNINISGLNYPSGNAVTMNFSGVTINGSGYTNGLANTAATYTDCTFNTADMYLYRSTKFINCTFQDTGTYALWTWGAGSVEFVGCVFNTTGKALYVNANVLDNGTNHQTVTITDCKFYDTGVNSTQKAAIETGDDYNCHSYDIFITNTIVEGFAVTEDKTSTFNYGGNNLGTNVWGNKYQMGQDKLNIVINGVDVY